MAKVYSKEVKVIKRALYCYSCHDSELACMPKVGGDQSYQYRCPRCGFHDYNENLFPTFDYIEDKSGNLEMTIIETFAKLLAFSDLPKYVNTQDPVLSSIVKKRLADGA